MTQKNRKYIPVKTSVRDTQYIRLLGKIFAATAISMRALFTPDLTVGGVYKLVKRALEAGHIKEMTYKEHYVDRYHTYSYYTITAKGINYLADKGFYQWSNYLPKNLQGVRIFPNGRKSSDIGCAVRRGNTFLLALNAGAQVSDFIFSGRIADAGDENKESPVENKTACTSLSGTVDSDFCSPLDQYDDDDVLNDVSPTEDDSSPSSMPLSKIKSITIQNMKNALGRLPEPGSTHLTFFPATEYKTLINNSLSSALKRSDFRFGKYTGVLASPVMSILLYHDERDGLKWDNKVEEADISNLCQFSRNCTEYKNAVQGNLRCGIIVANPISFQNIIIDRYHKRRTQTTLGKQFNSVYLIPQSPNGASLLSWIATNTQTAKRAYVDLAISNHRDISENQDGRRNVFRLLHDGHYLLDGFELEYKIIAAANGLKAQSPELTFSVVCFRWQAEFYNKLWPDVELLFID